MVHENNPVTHKLTEINFMIDEINYFPERENFQKKKKAADDWKELKKQKIFNDSKKSNETCDSPKPKSPPEEK
jgi:hypothetical protein